MSVGAVTLALLLAANLNTFAQNQGPSEPPGAVGDLPLYAAIEGKLMTATIVATLLASTAGVVSAQSEGSARPSSGCEAPLPAPGDYEAVNDFDGADQKYFVVVPPSYEDITPAPLHLLLASGGGDADYNYAGWRESFDDEPMLIAIIATATGRQRAPATLLALIDQLAADYCIDLRHVHVEGGSSSGYAAAQLACEGSDRIASLFDGVGSFIVSPCEPERPVPLLAITGDPDRHVVTRSVERWVEINGCNPEPLVEDLGSGIARKSYQGCEADVLFYDIEGLGHKVAMHECVGPVAELYCEAYEELDQLDEAQRFFAEHPLPE
jgi:poly(3-hydroxybutyrate) depolymerase